MNFHRNGLRSAASWQPEVHHDVRRIPGKVESAILLEGFVGKGARLYGAVRTNTHKYVEYGNGETELYDLEADPYELDNVYETADPSLIEDLKARLEALRDCQGEGCRKAEDAS